MGLAKGEWHDCKPQGLPTTAPASPRKRKKRHVKKEAHEDQDGNKGISMWNNLLPVTAELDLLY